MLGGTSLIACWLVQVWGEDIFCLVQFEGWRLLLLLHSDQLVLLELPAVQGNYPDVVVLVELDVVDL